MCRVVIGCIDVSWIVHFTLHNHWLRDNLPMDALLVINHHMRVLDSERYT